MPVNIVGSEAGAKAMLLKQLNSLFFISKIEEAAIDGEFGRALARCQRSFSKTRNKYYSEASATKFDPLQGVPVVSILVRTGSLHIRRRRGVVSMR